MRIRDVAAASGLSADTLRFYEREGLLDQRHARRTTNGYREYTEAAVARVAQIQQGQAAGFSLREIRELLTMLDGGRLTPATIIDRCATKLSEVDARIAALQSLQRYLQAKIRDLKASGPVTSERSPQRRSRAAR
jgi:DNA-binding transcriptional MerR regulator